MPNTKWVNLKRQMGGKVNNTEIESGRISEIKSNILDALTLDQAIKLAKKRLKSGFFEGEKAYMKINL